MVGGGYGGITVAKALDDVARVTLVEPRANFVHNVAALRAVVDPSWAERIFIPYGGMLVHGDVRRDRAVAVREGTVELASGDVLTADYVVLATGSSYPFPAKIEDDGPQRLHELHTALLGAGSVLLIGAGPVGIEFAGEIKAAWPEKRVIVADRSAELMPGDFPEEFRVRLREQIDEMGIELRLGVDAAEIETDLSFRCYGAEVNTDYLGGGRVDVAPHGGGRVDVAPHGGGRVDVAPHGGRGVEVTPELRVRGSGTMFAVGDITALPELKMARLAGMHAEVVAANIRSLLAGGTADRTYAPQPDAIVLPLGPKGGVTFSPEVGVLGAAESAAIKDGFYLDMYRELLGANG
ncbi:FAD-dependent oxidoreductase [Actinoplanes sp. LDG1-06]|uniref:FAD-dependent oxidoreductase n=1 Tax=Paractinoplanes ovalisporus TaxID=2810368 RepID=A0ABS2AKD3_9ACTN|nr:FAD-dependent oxidoreductase [Actinoplanes ovalisporus]